MLVVCKNNNIGKKTIDFKTKIGRMRNLQFYPIST